MDWNLVKEELFKNYKKELYLWLGVVLFLGLSLFLFMREFQKLTVNLQKLKKVETSYYGHYQEMMKLKERLKSFNVNTSQRIIITPFSGVYDLKDLNRAFGEIKALTQAEGHFFVLKEMTLLRGKEKNGPEGGDVPWLKINGELVIFMDGGG
jgi:hypothetical protein